MTSQQAQSVAQELGDILPEWWEITSRNSPIESEKFYSIGTGENAPWLVRW